MSDKIFIDTNILIYLYSKTELGKRDKIIKSLENKTLVISTQVLNELSNILIKKFYFSVGNILAVFEELSELCLISIIRVSTIKKALIIHEQYKYSYYDSLIISSALDKYCNILYSEDMHNSQTIENSLTILNPFKF
ncbi:MAG: PIN domain-containing protein [bacterium]